MCGLSNRNAIYREDILLFTNLGLQLYEDAITGQIQGCGRTTFDNGVYADVEVTHTPAPFWCIYLTFPDSSQKRVRTGSGALAKYWERIIDVSNGNCRINDCIVDDVESVED